MRTFAQKPTPQAGTASSLTRNRPCSLQHQAVRLLKSTPEELHAASTVAEPNRFAFDLTQIPVSRPSPVQVQPKLRVNTPGDKYEQEADRVAEHVMRMPDATVLRRIEEVMPIQTKPVADTITPLVQRQTEPEQEEDVLESAPGRDAGELGKEEEDELVQAKRAGNVPPQVTPAINAGIQSLRGGGRPLSRSERSFFEPRFGTVFPDVRVHTDTKAAGAARSVNARAFTLGRDVVFGAGEYSSGTSGRKLLAHELTHVVQQIRVPGRFNSLATVALKSGSAPDGVAQAHPKDDPCAKLKLPSPKPTIADKAQARSIGFINKGYAKSAPFVITPITTHSCYISKNELLTAQRTNKTKWRGKIKIAPWMIKRMRKVLTGLKPDLSNFPAKNGIQWTGKLDKCNIFVYDSLWDDNRKLIGKSFYRPVNMYKKKARGFTHIPTPSRWKCVRRGDIFASNIHTGIVKTKPNKVANVFTLEYATTGIKTKFISLFERGYRFFRVN